MLVSQGNSTDTELRLPALPAWQPEQYRRILILAPHPDDEVLAAGGVISTVLANESPPKIQVVVVTAGDASYSAVWLKGHNPISRHNFRHLAVERRQESLSALALLGVTPGQIHFWGFPDRGLEPMWQHYWSDSAPYRSRTTGRPASVPARSGQSFPNTGIALLGQMLQTLNDFQPDALIMPHVRDAHPDHRALARFTLLAVALHWAREQALSPELLAYIVWPGGFRRDPARSNGSAVPWVRLLLTPQAREQKAIALQCYRSQAFPLRLLLRRRAHRAVEVFARLRLPTVTC